MMEQSRHSVSVNTEIPDMPGGGIAHFLAAVGWGSIAGTAALLAIFFMSGGSTFGVGDLIGAVLFVGFFVALFAFTGMLLIGLPVTFVLRALRWESVLLYAVLGAIAGILVIALTFGGPLGAFSGFPVFAASGGLAGGAAAWSWGLWREKRAAARQRPQAKSTSARRENPIHDLIH